MVNHVYHDKSRGIYNVRKKIKGVTKHFGTYKNKEEAELAVELFEKTGWHPEDNWAVKAEVKEIIRNKGGKQ